MTNQEAISVLESIDAKTDYFLINDDARAEAIDMAISALQAQNLQQTCNQLATDTISRQAVRYKLAALVNEFEEILSHIREREVDDSVCGLCEYDGAYIGQSGDWCNECPGSEKDDCFKLKEKYRKEWTDING